MCRLLLSGSPTTVLARMARLGQDLSWRLQMISWLEEVGSVVSWHGRKRKWSGDNNEAGSGVIVPDHKVNCSPSEVFFLIFLDFLGVNFCCIINSRGPGGPEAEVNPGPGWPDLTFCLEIRIRIHQHASSLLTFYFDLRPSCWTGTTKDSGWCKSRK